MPELLKSFNIHRRKTNVGIIVYNKAADLIAPFNGPNSRSTKKAISFVNALNPEVLLQTRTDKGLIAADKQLFTNAAGDRKKKQNVLVTFTDGRAWPQRRIKPFSETVPPLRVSGFYFIYAPFGVFFTVPPLMVKVTSAYEPTGQSGRIKFAGTHLYTWVERGTVRVQCLTQEHDTMFLARARTRTARSGVEIDR